MGNAYGSRRVLVLTVGHKVVHLAFSLADVEFAVGVYERNSGTVISPVLQSAQSFYQYRIGILVTYVSNYSTHELNPLCIKTFN